MSKNTRLMVKCWIKSCLLMCSGNPHRNSLQGNVTDLQSFSTQVPSSHPSVSDTENARRGPRHAPQTAGSVVTRRLDSFSREVTQRCVVAGQRPVPRSESPPLGSGLFTVREPSYLVPIPSLSPPKHHDN